MLTTPAVKVKVKGRKGSERRRVETVTVKKKEDVGKSAKRKRDEGRRNERNLTSILVNLRTSPV